MTPSGELSVTFMSSGPMLANTVMEILEREKATFRRLLPPSWLTGPKFIEMRPRSSGP